jgi:hypothetical protein
MIPENISVLGLLQSQAMKLQRKERGNELSFFDEEQMEELTRAGTLPCSQKSIQWNVGDEIPRRLFRQ